MRLVITQTIVYIISFSYLKLAFYSYILLGTIGIQWGANAENSPGYRETVYAIILYNYVIKQKKVGI